MDDGLHQFAWNKAQLGSVLTGIFLLGYGRPTLVRARSMTLHARLPVDINEAIDYTCSLAMALTRTAEADAEQAAAAGRAARGEEAPPEPSYRIDEEVEGEGAVKIAKAGQGQLEYTEI